MSPVSAQDTPTEQAQAAGPPVESRVALIEQQQAEKAASLVPVKADKIEAYVTRISDIFLG